MRGTADREASVAPQLSIWAPLHTVGAVAAWFAVGLMAIQMVIFLMWPPPAFEPTPGNVRAWFALFDSEPWVALANLDALMAIDFLLLLLVMLALWSVLHRRRPVTTAIALLVAVVAAAVYLGSNPAFTMLSLADGHRSASLADRELYVAAGQAALAVYHGTPFDVGYVLSAIAGLLMSHAMLGSQFGRVTAYLGIGTYVMNLVPATAGTLGFVLSLASLLPLVGWLVLVGRGLRRPVR
jgi:hypothetical protein